MDKLNYKFNTGFQMPNNLQPDDIVRVIMIDGYAEYGHAIDMDWSEVETYAIVGEE